jgi:hypothetical protein
MDRHIVNVSADQFLRDGEPCRLSHHRDVSGADRLVCGSAARMDHGSAALACGLEFQLCIKLRNKNPAGSYRGRIRARQLCTSWAHNSGIALEQESADILYGTLPSQ